LATQEIDPQELAKRYAAEREKRVREDGTSQYIELKGLTSKPTSLANLSVTRTRSW
jgi:hypothetical protein